MFPFIWNLCPFQPANYSYYAVLIKEWAIVSFNLPFFISSLLSSRVYSSLKDSFRTNLIITSSEFFISEEFKILFNFSLFALQLVINLVTYAFRWTSFIHFEIQFARSSYWWFPSLCARNNISLYPFVSVW